MNDASFVISTGFPNILTSSMCLSQYASVTLLSSTSAACAVKPVKTTQCGIEGMDEVRYISNIAIPQSVGIELLQALRYFDRSSIEPALVYT